MELSSSLPLDLLALADPATRGAASPLAFKQGDTRGGGTALPFELCLELLEPAIPSGETLPLSGNPLPVALDEDTASELDVTETLALALPGLLPAPIVVAALPAGSADPAPSLASGAGPAPPVAAQNLSLAQQQPAAPVAAPSIATEAQDSAPAPAPAAAAVAAPATEANAWLATLAEAQPETPQAAGASRAAGDSRATATTASTVATNADYAAEAAVVAPRGETGAVAARRNEEPSRGTARIAWRDVHAAGAAQPSPQATVDTPDVALPTTSPAAAPFVAAMRGDVAAAFATSTAPVAEAGSVPGGHSTLHAASAQHSSTTAQTAAAAATPDRAPVDTTTPRWQEAFASRVQWLANQNIGEAHIRLNPPELGAVDVKISLVEDRTFVQLTTHTTAARDELAQSLPRLRELFAASGLELGGASVATGRDGQARNDGASADQPYASRQMFTSGGDDAPATTAPARRSAAGASRIDLFA